MNHDDFHYRKNHSDLSRYLFYAYKNLQNIWSRKMDSEDRKKINACLKKIQDTKSFLDNLYVKHLNEDSPYYKDYDKEGLPIFPGMPCEVPTKWGAFTVVLNEFGTREIVPPQGYELPRQLRGTMVTLVEAIRKILEYDKIGEEPWNLTNQS